VWTAQPGLRSSFVAETLVSAQGVEKVDTLPERTKKDKSKAIGNIYGKDVGDSRPLIRSSFPAETSVSAKGL
jgi:hypothetical protein